MKRTTKVSLGLFATWAISDIEELWTTSRNNRDVLRKRCPLPFPACCARKASRSGTWSRASR